MKTELLERDGIKLFLRAWFPEGQPKAIVHIAHGMAEHTARYQWLAEQLNAAGYAVYAADHRGHGETAVANGVEHGHYQRGEWMQIVDDLYFINQTIRERHPELPIVLLGHSMGSHLSQTYLIKYSHSIHAALISGTTGKTKPLLYLGLFLAKFLAWFKGPASKVKLLETMSYDEFNKPFNKKGAAKTRFDWLSRDQEQVDKYVADPWCGFPCTNQFWVEVFSGIAFNETDQHLEGIRKDLPVYLITGSEDTSNNAEQGVRALESRYLKAGISNVVVDVYPEGRHEMYNETNREQVAVDTIRWFDSVQ